ncbi:MAG: GAF domain-containing protein [Sandaracinaceae bacterium]|nr:GAF domain-containing protein [Sandaracinaceae bacterium]
MTETFEKPALSSRPPPGARPRSIIPPEHESWDAPEPPNKVDKSRVSPPDARRLPPIGEQISAIRRSHDRDEVAQLACRAATTVARCAVLLALRKDVLRGWDGWGGSLSKDGVRNLWIPTKSPSLFREALSSKSTRRAGGGHSTAADALFRAAVSSRGGELVLCPIVAGGRVVAVLAADDVSFGDAGVERLETLARAVGEAFERIIVDTKNR